MEDSDTTTMPEQKENMSTIPLWINGLATNNSDKLISVYSAALQRTVYHAHAATIEDAERAVAAAQQAFQSWKDTCYSERRSRLLRVADILERRIDEISRYQMEETSCTVEWSRFNVVLACKALREICANITIACTGEIPPSESKNIECLVYKEAVGPVLAIAPWNGSVILALRAIGAPLAAGCTVVFKASELCPRTHHAIVEAFIEADFPHGCVNQIQAHRDDASRITEAIIANPAIRKIEFIGSAAVGSIIGQLASKYLKPVLMELGGKCPAIILKDADLEQAAQLCVRGAFMNHGQICVSTERIIVVRQVAKEFIAHLQSAFDKFDGAGFAVSKDMAQKAHRIVSESLQMGAVALMGGNGFIQNSEASLQPVILTEVQPGMRIHEEETFGPSASVYVVEDEAEAIRVANDTPYGLNAAVHSKDIMAALNVAKQIECGLVNINSVTMYDTPSVPIGGQKGSGWGRNNGKYAVQEFLVDKTITIHSHSAVAFGSEHQ